MKNNKSLSMLVLSVSAMATINTASADIQQLDDVIISQSLCVGNDCVNGESFGFDTIRLKENNLRIHFQDTSNSASFPTNDWRLIANDSGNGGGNYFAIEDSNTARQPFRVDAGAPANSLRVDSAGDVGIGEDNPIVELHVVDGDSPTLRLEQDGSSGFTPQTFDMVSNEANFFIRDVTNGSQLPFRIKPGADTDSLFIAANNNIGIGTDSPDSNLDIQAPTPEFRLTGLTSGFQWEMRMNGAGNFNFQPTSGNTPLSISPNATNNLLEIGKNANDEVTITGNLVIVTGNCIAAAGGDGNCGADYVFEPDYHRPSLEELKEFVTTNKHLPNIPPASDMAENGIKLTELSVQLLAKVEELTLYAIDQQEVITSLQDRLVKLEGSAE
ncbi:hypothetical protein NBRC116583_15340 [Arenicella sp. 4NH20-0111]|uniref:hypothetical protein n=1 Tax=Arenicella sp. 4NH20-0111 TaxID=3127648 RepID=UPI00310C645C